MEKLKKIRGKKTPKGFDLIEPTLMELTQKLRDGMFVSLYSSLVENAPHDGKRKAETYWPIFRLHHQRSRYVFELFYKKKQISRELYEYCLKAKWADAALIAKWKKDGYEKLCCL